MRLARILLNNKKIYQELYNHSKNIPKINILDNKNIDNYYTQQISPKDINLLACEYKKYNKNILNEINYDRIKDYWNTYSTDSKLDIFLKFNHLVKYKYKDKLIAYTMISHNKSLIESEKDTIKDLTYNIDKFLLKFNDIYKKNKVYDSEIKYNPLNGFVSCSTSFNSNTTSLLSVIIPLLFGNSVMWNPHCNSILIHNLFYEILIETGIPKGLINFLPLNKQSFIDYSINNKNLGCLILENSFYSDEYLNKFINNNKLNNNYNFNPKLINSNYSNNFHFIDESICIYPKKFKRVVEETFYSAYNFSGQNNNSCSRVYLPYKYYSEFIKI